MKSFLEKNLQYLSRIDKLLAARIRDIKPDDKVKIEESKTGVPTLKAISYDGVEIQLYSLYDPLTEVSRFFESQNMPKADAYAISGFGLGYHALELAGRLKNSEWILIIEARDDVFRTALEFIDLSRLLTRKNVSFFVGDNLTSFLEWQRYFLNKTDVKEVAIIPHPPAVRLLPEFYTKVSNEVKNALNRRGVELATLKAYGEILERNAINNIFELSKAIGVRNFEGKFKDVPAIVVAAGPSLNENIELLAKVQNSSVVICVGKVLKLLLSKGIEPHFAAHLDMMPEYSNAYFDKLSANTKATLLFDADSACETVEKFAGRKVGFESNTPTIQWAIDFIGKKGFLTKGLTVAHTAFYFARYTGANPIILVGVDLAFPSKKTHADGVIETWGGEVSQQKFEMSEVPSVGGGKVLSVLSFQAMVSAFEVEIAKTKATVVNTSSKGALIRGAINMSIKDAIEKYCKKELKIEDVIENAFPGQISVNKEKLLAKSKELNGDLNKVIELAETGLGYGKRLNKLDKTNKYDQKEFKKLIEKIYKNRDDLLKMNDTIQLLRRLVSEGMMNIKELDEKVNAIDKKVNVAEYQRLENGKVRIFFESYLKAAKFYKSIFEPVKAKLLEL